MKLLNDRNNNDKTCCLLSINENRKSKDFPVITITLLLPCQLNKYTLYSTLLYLLLIYML